MPAADVGLHKTEVLPFFPKAAERFCTQDQESPFLFSEEERMKGSVSSKATLF